MTTAALADNELPKEERVFEIGPPIGLVPFRTLPHWTSSTDRAGAEPPTR